MEEDELQINEVDFQLLGWLKEVRSEYEGLDKNDPFANGVSKNYIVFGTEVEKFFDISYSKYFKVAFHNEKPVSFYQNWSNLTDYKNHSKFESEGCLLEIDVSFLLDFLQKRDVCLIVECAIRRHFKERDYNFKELDKKNDAKLYLIKSNGEVKTIRGRNYKIG